ncbi:hypothetical protein CLU79DRAFT_738549, partial [Phycomyces nitens]
MYFFTCFLLKALILTVNYLFSSCQKYIPTLAHVITKIRGDLTPTKYLSIKTGALGAYCCFCFLTSLSVTISLSQGHVK